MLSIIKLCKLDGEQIKRVCESNGYKEEGEGECECERERVRAKERKKGEG